MSIRFGFILGVLLLLTSCAQIEPLSGGDKDIYAPQPDLENMSPRNGSTNFQGQQMVIPFNEFFTLNNPSENIVVVPPDIQVKAKIKNKSLVLSWDEPLQPNTTYTFYMNGALKDVTEKNDSLMQFVFSSGPTIDSLRTTIVLRDAYTKAPLPNHTVGLYSQFDASKLPRYFGKTDRNGLVTLSYIKNGEYDVVAFEDLNKNIRPDITESFGFLVDRLILLQIQSDTSTLLVSPTKTSPKITSFKLVPPGAIVLAANRSLENAKLTINGAPLRLDHSFFYSKDSIYVPFEYSDSSVYQLIVRGTGWTDTSSFRMTQGEKNVALALSPSKKTTYFQDETLLLLANQNLTSAELSSIQLLNAVDSSIIEISHLKVNGSRLEFDFARKTEIKTVLLSISPIAILASHGRNTDTVFHKFSCLSDKDVGILRVSFEGFETDLVVELLSNGKTESKTRIKKGQWTHVYKNLLPGEFTFRVVIDGNENGLWDGGDYPSRTEPEEVIEFNQSKKVRGNWESEIILKKSGNGD